MTVIRLPKGLGKQGRMELCPACALALANDQEMKHTPGPWKIATTYADAQRGQFDIVPWASQRQRVCRITARADYPVAQANADAELIAAAPDLLAACRAASISLIGDEEYAKHRDLLRTLDAAIARATGQARMHRGRPVHRAQLLLESSVVPREGLARKLRSCARNVTSADPEIAAYVIDDMDDEEAFADLSSGHCRLRSR